MVSRATAWMSTYVEVEISPDTTTSPVFTSVSQATRPVGSSRITASRTPSEIWSATLSGWPSVTDSEVNRYSFSESCWLIGRETLRGSGAVGRSEGSGSRPARRPLTALLLPAVVVDHQRPPLEPVALAQPVLEEEAVVPREQPPVRDLDREA